MSRTIKSRDFKALQREWYDKLKATGFSDIEFNENSPFVKDNHLRMRRRIVRGWRSGQQALFEAGTDYLSGSTASRRSERIHVAMYLRGLSAVSIAERFGATLRAVQKQIGGFLALVRKDARAYETEITDEQTEEGSLEKGGVEEDGATEHLPGSDTLS